MYINTALSDLKTLWGRISSIGLYSPNESLEELPTKDMIYMSVPFIIAEVESSARTTNRSERMERLKNAQVGLMQALRRS